MNFDQISDIIKEQRHFKTSFRLSYDDDFIDFLIEAENFFSPMEFRIKLIDEIESYYTNQKRLTLQDVELIDYDESNLLSCYFFTNFIFDDALLIELSESSSDKVLKFRDALIILYDKMDLNLNNTIEFYISYFNNATITDSHFSYFSISIIKSIIQNINIDNKLNKIKYRHIENLTFLIQNTNIKFSKYDLHFFKQLFLHKDNLTENHEKLFCAVISKNQQFLIDLTQSRLLIDPFTYQINHIQWLKDTKKMFLLDAIVRKFITSFDQNTFDSFLHRFRLLKVYIQNRNIRVV